MVQAITEVQARGGNLLVHAAVAPRNLNCHTFGDSHIVNHSIAQGTGDVTKPVIAGCKGTSE